MSTYAGTYLRLQGLSRAEVVAFDVRQDGRGNACMAHIRDDGMLSSWEAKEPSLHWFRTRGSRGLVFGHLGSGTALRVVVGESFTDAISFAQLFRQGGDLYVSTAGTMSSKQVWQMAALATANP